jgi:hypothetical protein
VVTVGTTAVPAESSVEPLSVEPLSVEPLSVEPSSPPPHAPARSVSVRNAADNLATPKWSEIKVLMFYLQQNS